MTVTLYEARRTIDGDMRVQHAENQLFTFPGGEWSVDLEPTATVQIAFVQFSNSADIMAIATWADAVKRHGLKSLLVMPYLPAARADRGTPLGAKVYADVINSLSIDRIVCLDPHSDVAPALYDRLDVVSLDSFFPPLVGWDGVIIPDVGAVKRAESVANKLGVPAYQAKKHRDFSTGKLSGFDVSEVPEEGRMLIVDDICDGGGTFMGLASLLKQGHDQLGLWVTHGIFSKDALPKLQEHFAHIYTTDSIPMKNPGTYAGLNTHMTLRFLVDVAIEKVA